MEPLQMTLRLLILKAGRYAHTEGRNQVFTKEQAGYSNKTYSTLPISITGFIATKQNKYNKPYVIEQGRQNYYKRGHGGINEGH